MDPHVVDPAGDTLADVSHARPTGQTVVDDAHEEALDDAPERDDVDKVEDEAAVRAAMLEWLDAKLLTVSLETTNLKQIREWANEACPGASQLSDFREVIRDRVTAFVSQRKSDSSDAEDSSNDSSSDSDSKAKQKENQRRSRNQKKSGTKDSREKSKQKRRAKLDSDVSSSDSSNGKNSDSATSSSSSSEDNDAPSRVVSRKKKSITTYGRKKVIRKSKQASRTKQNQPPRQRKERASGTRRTTRTRKPITKVSHGPKLDVHESFVKEMATVAFVSKGIDALGLNATVLGPSLQGKEDDFVTPEWNKLCSDTTATLNTLAWSLRSAVVPSEQVARMSRTIFDQMPVREPHDQHQDDGEMDPVAPVLDQAGKVKNLAHALESFNMQARLYKALFGAGAPSDWSNRKVKDLYRDALAFKLTNADSVVAKLVKDELCGLGPASGGIEHVTKCLKITRLDDDAAFEPFRSGLGNVRMLWMPVEAVSLMYMLQCGPNPPPNTAAMAQYSGVELFTSGAGAVNEALKRSVAYPKSLYFMLVETACGESLDTSNMEFGDEWPTCADSLWTSGAIAAASEDGVGVGVGQSAAADYEGDDTDGAWKSWKFEKRDHENMEEAAGMATDGGQGDADHCSIWRRGSSSTQMTSGTRVSVFDHGQMAIRFLVEVAAS